MQTYNITPVPKPRMTRRDKWQQRPCVLQYRAFKDECRDNGLAVYPAFEVVFILPMPPSWKAAQKEKHLGKPHTCTPDIDNMVKALLDAVLDNDSGVYKIHASKFWGTNGAIIIDEIKD